MTNKKSDNTELIDLDSYIEQLFNEVSAIIDLTIDGIRAKTNSAIVTMFWNVGKRINSSILENKRAEYGKRVMENISERLQNKYGKTFEVTNPRRMLQFAEKFPEGNVVARLAEQLTWSHFTVLIPIKDAASRLYYAEQAITRHLGKRDLRLCVERKEHERNETANLRLSGESLVPFNAFKDPYLLDILGLKDSYSEKDLEDAILEDLEKFLMEFGRGFTFAERQKRITIDGEDYYLDLLLYHRD